MPTIHERSMCRDAVATNTPTVTVGIGDLFGWVDHPVASRVVPLLQRRVHCFTLDRHVGVQHITHCENSFREDECGIYFPAGLISRVVGHLTGMGYTCSLDDQRQWKHSQLVDSSLLASPDLSAEEAEFLRHIAGSNRGINLVSDADEVVRRIGLAAALFPESRILVIAKNRAAVNRLKKGLAKLADRPVIDHSDNYSKHPDGIMVTTSFLAGLWCWRYWNTVIISDVESATTKWMIAQNIELRHLPTYCIFNAANLPTDSRRIMLEENFGPIVGGERDDQSEAVAVVFADTLAPGDRRNDRGLKRKRSLFWHNQQRNDQIAGIARAFVENELDTLTGYGLDAGHVVIAGSISNSSVAILVESPEQGRQLQRHLPGWKLRDIHSNSVCVPGIGNREIGTFCCADRWGIHADVLIRADGTGDWPLGTGRFPSRLVGTTGSPMLIDFSDRMDRQSKRDTASRRAAYKALEWPVSNITGDMNMYKMVTNGELGN